MRLKKEIVNKISEIKFVVFDFDGVFTDNSVFVTETGEEAVVCWRSDGIGLSSLKSLGMPIWVISTETNPVVSRRCEKLGIECIQGCKDKLKALNQLLEQYQCDYKYVAFTGNDSNDIECLKKVGFPITVADAHEDVRDFSIYQTKKNGGKGAVREICDLIVKYSSLSKEYLE